MHFFANICQVFFILARFSRFILWSCIFLTRTVAMTPPESDAPVFTVPNGPASVESHDPSSEGNQCNSPCCETCPTDCPEQVSSTEVESHGDWGVLTEDLRDKVVACMTLHNVFQFLVVSKSFGDIIRRSSFLQPRSHHFRVEGKFTPTSFFIDPAERRWHWLGFDLISQKWSRLPSLSTDRIGFPDALLCKEFLVTGSGGLLCINVSTQPNLEKLKICNPVTGAIRDLPPMNFPRQPVVMHIILDKDINNYKVIVAGSATPGSEKLSRKTEVYDSTTRKWEVTGDVPGPEFGLNEYQTGAFSEGILYCVGFLEGGNVATRGILAYHVESGEWIRNWRCTLPALECCQHVTSSNTTQIFESEGSIFLYWEQEHSRTLVHFCIAKLELPVDMSHCDYSVGDTPTHDSPFWSVQVSENKSGSRGLLLYPEYIGITHGPGKVCIFNTLDLTGSVHKVGRIGGGPTTSKPLPLDPVPETMLRGLSRNIQPIGKETAEDGIGGSSGRPLFHPLNAVNFSFEPSFHTPV